MALNTAFNKVAKTIFKVFKSLAVSGSYVSVSRDFEGTEVENAVLPIDLIRDTFAERDTQFLSFYNQIQPTDLKGLVRGEQLTGVGLSTEDKVRAGTDEYHVIAWDTDPATAVYTLLLRKT
jgi:hypothetical protein